MPVVILLRLRPPGLDHPRGHLLPTLRVDVAQRLDVNKLFLATRDVLRTHPARPDDRGLDRAAADGAARRRRRTQRDERRRARPPFRNYAAFVLIVREYKYPS